MWELVRETAPVVTACAGLVSAPFLGLTASTLLAPAFLWTQRSLIRGEFVRPTTTLASARRVKEMKGKNVIVTGASTGIGAQLAIQFAVLGANVLAVTRRSPAEAQDHMHRTAARDWMGMNPRRRSDLVARIDFAQADFESLDQVRRLVSEIHAERWVGGRHGIHVLVNCAGTLESTLRRTAADGLEAHLQVNHVAPFILTEGLAPLVAMARDDAGFLGGRVINVVSSAHAGIPADEKAIAKQLAAGSRFDADGVPRLDVADPSRDELAAAGSPMQFYALSKLLQVMHSDSLASRGICSACVSPGPAVTDVWRHYAPIVAAASPLLTALVMKTAAEASATPYDCALRDDLAAGGYYIDRRLRQAGRGMAACNPTVQAAALSWSLKESDVVDGAEDAVRRPHHRLFRTGESVKILAHSRRSALMPTALQEENTTAARS